MYLTKPSRRRGLGQLPTDYLIGLVNPAIGAGMIASDLTGCSFWEFLTGGCGAKLATSAMQIPGVQQIQSVPANAAAYGYPSSVVATAQAAADQQSAQVPQDLTSIANYYSSSIPGLSLPGGATAAATLSSLSAVPPWAWLVGLGAGALVLVKILK